MSEQIDKVSIELMAMSDAEFKRRYMDRSMKTTLESSWGQACTVSVEEEGDLLNVNLNRKETEMRMHPSNIPFIRRWSV